MKKILLFLAASIVFAVAMIGYALHVQYTSAATDSGVISAVLSAATVAPAEVPVATTEVSAAAVPAPTPLPEQVHLAVPYTLQAPFNKWDALHEDACEETSLIMTKHYLDHTPIGTPAQADSEITNLVHWEQQNGYGPSISLQQLNQIAKDYYGIQNGSVVTLVNVEQIRQEVAQGHPAIVGMAGKLLPNPHFSNGGPNYHMLVAVGYDATGIITNEPGTYAGDGYHYPSQAFDSAVHNWNATNILDGQREYLVFK